jgi:hypothetical protein
MNFTFSAPQADILKNLLRWQTTLPGGLLFGRVGKRKASPVRTQ